MSNRSHTHMALVSTVVLASCVICGPRSAAAVPTDATEFVVTSALIENTPAWTATGSSESALLGNPVASADAAVRWEQVAPRPPARSMHALAYDSARGRVVLFGGYDWGGGYLADTWEWDGADWVNVTPAVSPPGRRNYALAYDSDRGRVVLFGGIGENLNILADTWEWDGTDWVNVTPAVSPSPRFNHALVYDSARGRVLLFGGSGGGYLADTWEWDGTDWVNVTPAVSPPARGNHALAYDSARGRVVLFGGTTGGGNDYADTWEWDGTLWDDVTPAVSPPASMYGHALTYDSARGRVVLFNGSTGMWEWDGTEWVNVAPAVSLPVSGTALTYDSARDRAVLFGGRRVGTYYLPETWEWDGTDWVDVTPAESPPARSGHAMAYDSARGRVVLFGGYDWRGGRLADTWEWDGTAWADVTPAVSPPASSGYAMLYDSARSRVVLLERSSGAWEWDGTEWVNVTPAASPPVWAPMAYDSARGRIVLFGGGGTWEWDGTEWMDVTPALSPPARWSHPLAYDSARGRVVLFGGYNLGGYLGDTWEWDGTAWEDVTPAVSPPERAHHSLAYDSARGRVVLFGGFFHYSGDPYEETYLGDTWEWDGTEWVEVTPAVSPPERGWHAMTYDSARGRVVMMGGDDGDVQALPDTWEYGPLLERACDDLDDNNNGLIDEGCDDDEDGYCDAGMRVVGFPSVCPHGVSDCDDDDATVYPGALEVCDGVDNDCDGATDEDLIPEPTTCGLGACASTGEMQCIGGVLTDTCTPGQPSTEVCDGLDNDCDGVIPADEVDADEDWHFPICGPAWGIGDCDDSDPYTYEFAPERCDGKDNDCDGLQTGEDEDGDGYLGCEVPFNKYIYDCDDGNPDIYPLATGICDGHTNNCICWPWICGQKPWCDCHGDLDWDEDYDGFSQCEGDCRDDYDTVYPNAPEICDGLNNDCYDANWPTPEPADSDDDYDGFPECMGDCDDSEVWVYPNASEICDGLNNDCLEPRWPRLPAPESDDDRDGFSECGGDCNDARADVYPGAPEILDRLDNDCDGVVDEDVQLRISSAIKPTTLNRDTRGTDFTVSLQITDVSQPTYPRPVDGDYLERTYLSRVGSVTLPDPLSFPCPGPGGDYGFERGISDNPEDRVTAQGGAGLRFNRSPDGDCRTLDGDRQDLLAILADVPDGTEAPICVAGTVDGIPFESCTTATVNSRGNR